MQSKSQHSRRHNGNAATPLLHRLCLPSVHLLDASCHLPLFCFHLPSLQLLLSGSVLRLPPVPTVSEAELKQVDIQEGFQVDLAPGAAVPCVVSFAPGQERRVYFAGGLPLCVGGMQVAAYGMGSCALWQVGCRCVGVVQVPGLL
jgi:hypothetical protein